MEKYKLRPISRKDIRTAIAANVSKSIEVKAPGPQTAQTAEEIPELNSNLQLRLLPNLCTNSPMGNLKQQIKSIQEMINANKGLILLLKSPFKKSRRNSINNSLSLEELISNISMDGLETDCLINNVLSFSYNSSKIIKLLKARGAEDAMRSLFMCVGLIEVMWNKMVQLELINIYKLKNIHKTLNSNIPEDDLREEGKMHILDNSKFFKFRIGAYYTYFGLADSMSSIMKNTMESRKIQKISKCDIKSLEDIHKLITLPELSKILDPLIIKRCKAVLKDTIKNSKLTKSISEDLEQEKEKSEELQNKIYELKEYINTELKEQKTNKFAYEEEINKKNKEIKEIMFIVKSLNSKMEEFKTLALESEDKYYELNKSGMGETRSTNIESEDLGVQVNIKNEILEIGSQCDIQHEMFTDLKKKFILEKQEAIREVITKYHLRYEKLEEQITKKCDIQYKGMIEELKMLLKKQKQIVYIYIYIL